MSQNLLVGVDVGTGSARAGVFTRDGKLLGRHENPILMRRTDANFAEHDSEDIWSAVCLAVRAAMAEANADPADVVGIGFDATCSLVVRDAHGAPVTVSKDGEDRWDTIVWLDHRALEEADECTRTGHEVLHYAGGVMSPEMEVPKLMWLKRNLPKSWARAGQMFDLADFLSWKATGSLARSQSTLTCKWTYLGHRTPGWQQDFLELVGLGDLIEKAALPEVASPVGDDLGALTEDAANQLGLTTNCHVGAGLIDAHAGALGVLGAFAPDVDTIDRHLALIAGTSSCVMALSAEDRPTTGVWGRISAPYCRESGSMRVVSRQLGHCSIISSAGMGQGVSRRARGIWRFVVALWNCVRLKGWSWLTACMYCRISMATVRRWAIRLRSA